MNPQNPYSPPATAVEDPRDESDESGYLPEGRMVDAGAGARWITQGFSMVFAQFGTWLLITLSFFAIFMVMGMIPGINFFTSLVTPVFVGGLMIGARKQAQGGVIEVGDLFAGFRDKAGPLLICGLIGMAGWLVVILLSVAIAGTALFGAFIGGGAPSGAALAGGIGAILLVALLFLITAFVVYGAWWLAPALIVFHDVAPFEAMKRSLMIGLRNWLASLVYGLLAMMAMFLGTLALLVGLLVVVPAMFASTYLAYRDLFHED